MSPEQIPTLTRQQVLLDVGLDTTQKEGSQNLVKSLDYTLALLLFIHTIACILMQEAVQVLVVPEDLGADEVEQREKLLQIILQRRARDEQPSTRDERPNDFREDGVDVLDAVRLVDDDVLERELLECRALNQAQLVSSDADFEILRQQSVRDASRAFLFGSSHDCDIKVWRPHFELS